MTYGKIIGAKGTNMQVELVADAIRREVRLSAGISEGQEFQCDWKRAAEAAIDAVRRWETGD